MAMEGKPFSVSAEAQRAWIIAEANRTADRFATLRDSGIRDATMLLMLENTYDLIRSKVSGTTYLVPSDEIEAPILPWRYSASEGDPKDGPEGFPVTIAGDAVPWLDAAFEITREEFIDGCSAEYALKCLGSDSTRLLVSELFSGEVRLRERTKEFKHNDRLANFLTVARCDGIGTRLPVNFAVQLYVEFRRWLWGFARPQFDELNNLLLACKHPFDERDLIDWFVLVMSLGDAQQITPGYFARARMLAFMSNKEWVFELIPLSRGSWSYDAYEDTDRNGRPWFWCHIADFLRASELTCRWMAEVLRTAEIVENDSAMQPKPFIDVGLVPAFSSVELDRVRAVYCAHGWKVDQRTMLSNLRANGQRAFANWKLKPINEHLERQGFFDSLIPGSTGINTAD